MDKQNKKLDKNDLKGPDMFVSSVDRAWTKIERHRRIGASLVVALFAIGVAYTFFNAYKSKKETTAQVEYYLAKKVLLDTEKAYQPKPVDPKTTDPKTTDSKTLETKNTEKVAEQTEKKKTGNLDQDFGPAVTQLESVIKRNVGSKAAVLAALDLSPIFFEYKQGERAFNNLHEASKSVSKSDLLYGFLYMQLGNAQQANGKCEDAIKSWKLVSDSKNHTFLHSEALLNEGLCLESLGQRDKASEIYRRVSQDFGDTDAGKSAKNYLRLMSNDKS